MQLKVKDLAQILDGELIGSGEDIISGPGKIEDAVSGQVVFYANSKYEAFVYTTQASAILVPEDFEPKEKINAALIKVENVYSAVAFLLEKFQHLMSSKKTGVSKTADIHESAVLGEDVYIGSFVVIEEKVVLGKNVRIMGQNHIGAGTIIGDNCIIYSGVKIYDRSELGANCIIHANSVIGSDGFGFSLEADSSYKKIPQIGNVVIGRNVEIGSNCCIDRATMGSTIIEDGVKLDNLIQVGHNVKIKSNTVIAAQTGIAGSTTIGSHCKIGGQVGFSGHINVGDKVQIQAQSGISRSVKDEEKLFGSPAIGYSDYVKSYSVFKKLPDLDKRLKRIERAFES